MAVGHTAVIAKKSRHEIGLMRTAGQLVAEALVIMAEAAKPGISTLELDLLAEAHIRKGGAIPTV
jgi:methionyl aminopeptidase